MGEELEELEEAEEVKPVWQTIVVVSGL